MRTTPVSSGSGPFNEFQETYQHTSRVVPSMISRIQVLPKADVSRLLSHTVHPGQDPATTQVASKVWSLI